MYLLIALTERDKRIILMLFLLVIVLIAFIAIVGAIITRVMKYQGQRMEDLTHDVVITGVIENKKQFLHYARVKNWRLFVTQAWIPLLIVFVGVMTLILRNAITDDWGYNLVDHHTTGFTTIFFLFDLDDPNIYHNFFGMNLICDWPAVLNSPHFEIEAWASYIFFFFVVVGGTWYLIILQSLIARTIKMYQLSYSMYHKSLDGYNVYDKYKKPAPTSEESRPVVPPDSPK